MPGTTRETVLAGMQEAAERMGLDLEDLQEMINDVLDDCSGKVLKLKEAVVSNDFGTVRAIAHDIKGSTANYGLKTASGLALEIEKNNESSSVETVDKLIAQFNLFSNLDLDKR